MLRADAYTSLTALRQGGNIEALQLPRCGLQSEEVFLATVTINDTA